MFFVKVGVFKDVLWLIDKLLDFFKILKYGLLNKVFLKEKVIYFFF